VSQLGNAVLTITNADQGKNPLDKKPEEARLEIEAMENLRKYLVKLDTYEREGAPLSMRFGLYSGDRIYHDRLLYIYFNAVEHRFKRPTVKRLEDDLRKFTAGQSVANPAQLTEQEEKTLGENYDLLKAYLMLSGEHKDKAEATFLSNTLENYWKTEAKLPSDLVPVAKQHLDFYAKQVDRQEFQPTTLDKTLVDATRKKLQAFPAVFRYYKRVTTDISKKQDAVSTDTILAGRSAGVLEGSHNVPGAYTIEGYQQYMKDAISNAQQELTKDDWVMGEQSSGPLTQGTEIQRLQDKYFNDYTDHWLRFVRGINIKPYKKKDDAVSALKAFSSTESPMAIVVKEIKRQTNLSAKPKADGWVAWIMSFFTSAEKTDMGGETTVDKAFHPLVSFVGGEGEEAKTAPISKYTQSFKPLSDKLSKASESAIKKISEDIEKEDIGLANAKKNVGATLEVFTEDFDAGPDLAILLNKPLENLDVFFGQGGLEQIIKTWTEAVLPKAKDAEKGYPYEDSGDADLTKLTVYLNPVDGTLTDFYKKRLEKYFEESDGQLKLKTGSPAISPEFVNYLNNAFRLRNALFGKNAKPEFSYEFTLQKAGDTMVDIKIDGEPIDSSGTGSKTLKFPASSGDSGVLMSLGSGDAGSTSDTSLSGGSSSANSSTSTVNPLSNTNSASKYQPSTTSSQAGSTSRTYPGTWGLFKFFEAGAPKKQPGGEYLLTYKLGTKVVTATVKPTGGDLFDRSFFTSARAPQNVVKP
jgi:type VI secretion system protein ImpL